MNYLSILRINDKFKMKTEDMKSKKYEVRKETDYKESKK